MFGSSGPWPDWLQNSVHREKTLRLHLAVSSLCRCTVRFTNPKVTEHFVHVLFIIALRFRIRSPVPPILPNFSILTLPYEITGANEIQENSGVGDSTEIYCRATNNDARRSSDINVRSRITGQPSAEPRYRLGIPVSQQFCRGAV